MVKGRSLLVILGDEDPLEPFTTYNIYVDICTAGGCTASPVVVATTDIRTPIGLAPPTLHNITRTSVDIKWVEPAGQKVPIEE